MAVLIASVANLAGAFVTTAVAKNVAKGLIDAHLATQQTLLAALLGAIAWNLLTWWFGLPSSSSHALIGGLVGAALVQSGEKGVLWHGIAHKVVIPALAAPAIAFGGAFVLLVVIYWLFQWLHPGIASRGFKLGQLGTGTWVAFAHGSNDAQKTMGVIALALVLHRHGDVAHFSIPTWVKITAGLAIGLGTYAGGWRIIRTLGQRVVRMEPESGFAAQAAAGTTIYLASNARGLWRRDGGRGDETAFGRALGGRRQHRRRLGLDLACGGGRGGGLLLAGAGDFLAVTPSRGSPFYLSADATPSAGENERRH